MKLEISAEQFRPLYEGVERLEPKRLLEEELRLIRSDPDLEVLGEYVCQTLFLHSDLDNIPEDGIEDFIAYIDPFVAFCLNSKQARQ